VNKKRQYPILRTYTGVHLPRGAEVGKQLYLASGGVSVRDS